MKFSILDFAAAAPAVPPDTTVITQLLLTLFTVAVLLFCWLWFESWVAMKKHVLDAGSKENVVRARHHVRHRPY